MPGSVDIPAAGLGSPDEVAIAVEVKADFKPQSAAPKDGHPALTITQGEIGWAFKSSRKDGWVICQINPTSSDERIGELRFSKFLGVCLQAVTEHHSCLIYLSVVGDVYWQI